MLNTVCFDDVLLVPQYSGICSRSEITLSSSLGKDINMRLPIISSPMDTVTGSDMLRAMDSLGGLGIVHRYNTPEMQADLVREAIRSGSLNTGAAIGVSGDFLDRAQILVNAGVKVLCVDIAHGHHVLMRHALKVLRNTFGNKVHIMAGNVATLEGVNDLSDWGADSVRVGIGGGSICSTRVQTGHGVPTLQSIIDCSSTDRDVIIVADGGIRNSGDIVKALAAGADFVMLGSLLSGTDESPGEIIFKDGERYKAYRGMASKDAQIDWRGHTASIEGVSSAVPEKGPVKNVLSEMETGIRSGLSYSGAQNILELQVNSKMIKQTFSGTAESSTHITKIGV